MNNKSEIYQTLGETLEAVFKEMYGERMGFTLFVFPFGRPGLADYMSNGDREMMITALRETTKRLEANEIIGEIIGHA